MMPWACRVCTFRHEADKANYLQCAMCNTERQRDDRDNRASIVQKHPWSHKNDTSDNQKRKRETAAKVIARHNKKDDCRSSLNDALVRLPSFPVQVNGTSIVDQDIIKHCPAIFRRNVLPENLANDLLRQLENVECPTRWGPRSSWTVFDQTHLLPRTCASYQLTTSIQPPSGKLDGQSVWNDKDESKNAKKKLMSFPELDEAAVVIQRLVQDSLSEFSKAACTNETKTDTLLDWKPTFCFANRYQDGNETVGMHSDFLNPLGPRPIIVGLSLGATRTFRLQRNPGQEPATNTTGPIRNKSTGNKKTPPPPTTTVNIPMPHNSVIIMLGDCQEQWQHGVPRVANSSISSHSMVDNVRISLTFRMARTDLLERTLHPTCHCGLEAKLKANRRGRYYYTCSPASLDKDARRCNFYKPCAWAEQEAEEMREKEARILGVRFNR